MSLVTSSLLAVLSLALGFSLGARYVASKWRRHIENQAAAWESIVESYRVEPLVQPVRYPPAHQRLIN